MITVKRPVLLDQNLQESTILYPTKGSLKMEMNGVYEATFGFGSQMDAIPMHAWVKLYNQNGLVGIFRRTSGNNSATVSKSCVLRHGIDILQDSVYHGETTFAGTKAAFITAVLNEQSDLIQGPGDSAPRKPWVIGTCADTSSYTKQISYDNLLDLLLGAVDDGSDYYFTYDQSVWPWTVSLVQKTSAVQSEFRLSRNLNKCQIKDNDSELCTQLILNVNGMVRDSALSDLGGADVTQNTSVVRTYNNAAAQAVYGIITRATDIDVTRDTLPNGPFPEADAFAADYLARRAAPHVQIQIDGYELKQITGEDWDESRLGTVCRVALAEYPAPIEERVVSISYPELYSAPDKITVSLANALPTMTRSMSTTQQSVATQEKTSRSSARESANLNQHFTITDKAGNILKQAGMKLDANGALIYAEDNVNMVGSRFTATDHQIGMAVGSTAYDSSKVLKYATVADFPQTGSGSYIYKTNAGDYYIWKNGAYCRVNVDTTNGKAYYVKAGEIAIAINNSGETEAHIDANKVILGQSKLTADDLEDWAKDPSKNGGVFAKYFVAKTIRVKDADITNSLQVDGAAQIDKYLLVGKAGTNIIQMDGSDASMSLKTITLRGDAPQEGQTRTASLDYSKSFWLTDQTQAAANAHVKITQNGNNYILWYCPASQDPTTTPSGTGATSGNWINAGTFSRAVSSYTPTWSSGTATGVLTIKPNPQDTPLYRVGFTYTDADNPDMLLDLHVDNDTAHPQSGSLKKYVAAPIDVRQVHKGQGDDDTYDIRYTATLAINAETAYNNGWGAAYGKVSKPTNDAGTGKFSVKVPQKTVDAVAEELKFSLTKGMVPGHTGHAIVTMGDLSTEEAITVASLEIGSWYDAGWGAAYGKVTVPTTTNTTASMVVKTPSSTVDTATPVSTTYTLSVDADYAYLKTSGTTVAQVGNVGVTYDSAYRGPDGTWQTEAKVVRPEISNQKYIEITLDTGTLNTTTGKRTVAAKAGSATVNNVELSDYATGRTVGADSVAAPTMDMPEYLNSQGTRGGSASIDIGAHIANKSDGTARAATARNLYLGAGTYTYNGTAGRQCMNLYDGTKDNNHVIGRLDVQGWYNDIRTAGYNSGALAGSWLNYSSQVQVNHQGTLSAGALLTLYYVTADGVEHVKATWDVPSVSISVGNWIRERFEEDRTARSSKSLSIPIKVTVNGVEYSHTFTTSAITLERPSSNPYVNVKCGSVIIAKLYCDGIDD